MPTSGFLPTGSLDDQALRQRCVFASCNGAQGAYGCRQKETDMDCTTSIKHGFMYWGQCMLPMGAIMCGTHGSQALIWCQSGWHAGCSGVLHQLPQSVQRDWLQAIRANHGWKAADAAGVSRRTWEGWEQGRTITYAKVLALYELAQASRWSSS